jgi:5-(carboxyamino)imidazole ribonucleotide synthase
VLRIERSPGGFPVVGMIGGSRLTRMTYPAAIALGIRLRVLAESPTASAVQVVPGASVGDHWDLPAVTAFARLSDVLTIEHEHVPITVLEKLEADGVTVRPGPAVLAQAQDKAVLRRRLTDLQVPCSRWPLTTNPGHRPFDEESVEVRRGLAVLVARSPSGQAAAWPVVEAIHGGGICREVVAPAPGLSPELAARVTEIAFRIAGGLDAVGVLAVKMSEGAPSTAGLPTVVVDGLAMRPHDCGNWTIDGAVTSQFEQHLRAILDLPLGDPRSRARWSATVTVISGGYPDLYRSYLHVMARDPGVKVHLDGQTVRQGGVVGHVTVCGNDLDDVRGRARHAADFIAGVIDR